MIIQDQSVPKLQSFALDMNTASLLLTFDDIMVTSRIIVQSATTYQLSAAAYALTDSTSSSPNGRIIRVKLSDVDADGIKVSTALANSIDDSYLNLTLGSFSDMAGNEISAFAVAVKPTSYIADNTKPKLLSFDVDMTLRKITLSFSEAVAIASIKFPEYSLQNKKTGATETVSLVDPTETS